MGWNVRWHSPSSRVRVHPARSRRPSPTLERRQERPEYRRCRGTRCRASPPARRGRRAAWCGTVRSRLGSPAWGRTDRDFLVQPARDCFPVERTLAVVAQRMAIGEAVARERLAVVQAYWRGHLASLVLPRLHCRPSPDGSHPPWLPPRRASRAESAVARLPPHATRAKRHSSSTAGKFPGFSSVQPGQRKLADAAGVRSKARTISRARGRSRSSDTHTSGQASVKGELPYSALRILVEHMRLDAGLPEQAAQQVGIRQVGGAIKLFHEGGGPTRG